LPYVVVQDAYKTLPVNYWVYPQDEEKARPTYAKTPRMIRDRQRRLTGPRAGEKAVANHTL